MDANSLSPDQALKINGWRIWTPTWRRAFWLTSGSV